MIADLMVVFTMNLIVPSHPNMFSWFIHSGSIIVQKKPFFFLLSLNYPFVLKDLVTRRNSTFFHRIIGLYISFENVLATVSTLSNYIGLYISFENVLATVSTLSIMSSYHTFPCNRHYEKVNLMHSSKWHRYQGKVG